MNNKIRFIGKKLQIEKKMLLILLDVIVIQLACCLSIYLRFDFQFSEIPTAFWEGILKYSLINTVCTLVLLWRTKLYHSVWHYASSSELFRIIVVCAGSAILQCIGMNIWNIWIPRSYHVFYFALLVVFITFIRFFYRIMQIVQGKRRRNRKDQVVNVMLVGAGEAGAMILKEFQTSQFLTQKVVCFVDDNPQKLGKTLRGVPIEGTREDIPKLVKKHNIEMIILAIPSAERKEISAILEICKETGCQLKVLPGIFQLVKGEVSVSNLRNVEIEDLLGREPVKVQMEEIMDYVSGKTILVTGGGGSIGSELCRQIAAHQPKQLIIFDIYENNAYDIQLELKRKYPELNLVTLIGSVRNTHRINGIMEEYRPDIVYHAAAHKHVPLMEDSPNEAIKNNVFGTYKTACAADKYGVKRFVLISTDKAVNPTNIMGASKRLCEMVIQTMNNRSDTEFVAVRFGNVLGSNGSVIPLFKKQIEQGGPVTVTHPDIIRYFMTIPEAVSLVLQAGAQAKGGEIFVLDMGEPVKIADLAYNLIRLSGYIPGEDIKVEFTGLRPGEKLYEELLMSEEGLQDTENKLIHIGKPIDFDEENFLVQLKELKELAETDDDNIRLKVQEMVSTYHIQN